MVRRLAGRQGAYAPAGEEVRVQQPPADHLPVLLVQQSRPQQVPGVGRQGVDLVALPVQCERREGVLPHPEVPLEAVAQVGRRLFQQGGVRLVGPRRARHPRRAAQRVVRIALGARRHHRAGGPGAVGPADGAGGVLPVLVGEAALVGAVDEIPARGQPAVVQHPADRRAGVRFQPAGEAGVAGQFDVRAEQDQEQRGRVDRAVVPPERNLAEVRQLAVAHLVHDLAGLGDGGHPRAGRLGRGQRREGRRGQLRAVRQREQGGEQGVPAEQGEEPGGARGRYAQLLAVRSGRRHLQRGQVGQPAGAGGRQLRPAGREGHPLHEPAFQVEELLVHGGGRARDAQGAFVAVRAGHHAQRQLGRAMGFQVQGPHQAACAGAGLLDGARGGVGRDGRTGAPFGPPVDELDAVVQDLAGAHGARLDVGAVVGAEFELVGEVGVGGDGETDGGGHRAVAGHAQGLDERAVADGLFPEDGVGGRLLPAAARHQHAAGRVAVRDRGEHLGHRAVDGELPAAEMPGVAYE